jgi:hypothetical protein
MKSALFGQPRGGTSRAQALAVNTLTWGYPRPANAFTVTRTSARLEDKKQGPLVFAIFIAIQVLDGLLTYWGVTRFGIELEMNQLLAATMLALGPAPALLMAKGLACGCGLVLYANAYLRPLAAVAGLCLGLAVVPWLFLVTVIS